MITFFLKYCSHSSVKPEMVLSLIMRIQKSIEYYLHNRKHICPAYANSA